MKKGTLTNFFEKTGTYINMTPTEKKIELKKNKPKKNENTRTICGK